MTSNRDVIMGVDIAVNVAVATRQGRFYDAGRVRRLVQNTADAGCTSIFWRVSHTGFSSYLTRVGTSFLDFDAPRSVPGGDNVYTKTANLEHIKKMLRLFDIVAVAREESAECGLRFVLYMTCFDESVPEMTARFVNENPRCCWKHRYYDHRNPGLLSYGYPEVRAYKLGLVREMLDYEPDGIYLDVARSHSGAWPLMCLPFKSNIWHNYGFNDPECARYEERTGHDPRLRNLGNAPTAAGQMDWPLWQGIRGEFVTQFVGAAAELIHGRGRTLAVGYYHDCETYLSEPRERGRIVLGGIDLDYETWVANGWVDEIVLNSEHRRFGLPYWEQCSKAQYKPVQDCGVKVHIWWAPENKIDEAPGCSYPLPLRQEDNPDAYFVVSEDWMRRTLTCGCDGAYIWEAGRLEAGEHLLASDPWASLKRAIRR